MSGQQHPEVIGNYSIKKPLGEGGMGVVYLAEQREPVQRTVALKVARIDDGSTRALARFQAERQAIAVMDHPSIAKIFKAGITSDGYSYFAMEFVDGLPINEFCDAHRMSIRDRLALFSDLCHGVQHAHQKGLIHRDLKPSNILVTEVDGRPLPKIIDFGIAKEQKAEAFDGTRLTRDDQVMGTPAYMSPEQIRGSDDIDTRSDIYSLGIVLYELLVGALPFDTSAYAGWAALAATLHREFPTPTRRLWTLSDTRETVARSRSTSAPLLRAQLRGDLEWIVGRSLQKDPDARYETANAFALDIQRFLEDRPVRAAKQNRRYRARKFVRRNRGPVAVGTVASLGLITFAITTAIQAQRIAEARDLADARRTQAEELIDFMLGDLREKLAPLGRLEILDDVGSQAMAYFAALPESEFTDEELARRSQALYQIGEVRSGEGRLEDAREAFEESLRLARALSERAPANLDRLFDLGQSEFWVGYVDWRMGRFSDALQHLEPYRAVSERLVAADPDNLDWRLELGYANSNIGSIREAMGDFRGAASSFQTTLLVDSFMVELQPENPDRQLDLSRSHNTLGVVLAKAGEFEIAELHHRTEFELKRGLVDADPDNTIWLRELSLASRFLAGLLAVRGDDLEATELFREGLDTSRRLTRIDPENANWKDGLAATLSQWAGVHLSLDSVRAAIDVLGESRSLIDDLRLENPDNPRWRRLAAEINFGEARVSLRLRQTAASLAHLEEAKALLTPVLAEGRDPEAVQLQAHLHLLSGDVRAEDQDLEGAREDWVLAAQSTNPETETALTRAARAGALARLGQQSEAQAVFGELVRGGLQLREPWTPSSGIHASGAETPESRRQ